MKLVTFTGAGADHHVGVLVDSDQRVVDVTGAADGDTALGSLQSLIESGDASLDAVRERVTAANGNTLPVEEVTLHCPVPAPVQMRDCLCFEEHMERAMQIAGAMMRLNGVEPPGIPGVYYRQPIYYKCNRFACIGHETDIRWPDYAFMLDYEMEFGAWIGTGGRDISKTDAERHIFGYSIFNDVSARDAQMVEAPGNLGPAKGKDFDTSNVIGPCIVTADAIDPYDLEMIVRINGEEVSRGSSSTMTWRFDDVIAHVSESETLHPGEFLGSGTVGGGCGFERLTFLSPGDLIELEVTGIGVLRNRIVQED